jgi:hypothetical protein
MSFKFKALVLAVAMSASMNASADIANANTGNSELIFSVYTLTEGKETSFSLDTGITLSQFNTGLTANTTWAFTSQFAGGSTYATWYNALDASQKSGLQWNVMGGDSTGTQNYITTMTQGAVTDRFTGSGSQTNDLTRNFSTPFDSYVAGLNSLMTGSLTSDNLVATTADKTSSAYAGVLDGNWAGNLYVGSTAANIGTNLDLYKITASSSGVANSVWLQSFNTLSNNNYVASFDGSAFTMQSVAAVPEAGSFGAMISGLGLMAFIARRRARKSV